MIFVVLDVYFVALYNEYKSLFVVIISETKQSFRVVQQLYSYRNVGLHIVVTNV
jgi:uncharacterized protein Veg